MSAKKPRRIMTPKLIECALALRKASYPAASADKRFAREISVEAAARGSRAAITEAQLDYLKRMMHRYRRQLPAALVKAAEALDWEQCKEIGMHYRCQWCAAETLGSRWNGDKCPKCGRAYDAILAQEGDD